MMALLFLILGFVVVFSTVPNLFDNNHDMEDWAVSIATFLVLVEWWPIWLMAHVIINWRMRRNNK